MRVRLLATSIFIMSIVLLALATGRVVPAAVQGRSACPAALASPSDTAVAAPDLDESLPLGESPPFTPIRDNRPPISKNEQREHSNRYETYAALTRVEWDDCDSHKWIAEPTWGDGIEVDWIEFDSRKTLRAKITPAGNSWALMRTDAFPAENWEAHTGLRADIYQVGGASGIDIKLEVRGPQFDPPDLIQTIYFYNLQPGTWNTCTWSFDTVGNDYGAVAHLSIVFDHLGGTGPTFYVDNLRLVSATGEEEWDDMDDGSREWFYSGNWYDWNPSRPFGLESISHNGDNPTTSAGSTFLQWDYANGIYTGTTAEVGTRRLDDLSDWSGYNRISADVKVSDPDVPISVFLWNQDAVSTPVDYRGFGTPTRKVGATDTWLTLTWDLPWPPWFDNTDIDEIKFVANNIDEHLAGTLYLDNISLISDAQPAPVMGLEYIFEDFNDRNEYFNDFSGNWGELNGDCITTTFDTSTYTGTWGASLKVEYDVPTESFTGIWQSLWGHSEYTQTQYLDFTDIYGSLSGEAKDFEQIRFWVRGGGTTTGTHNIKVELKDNTDDFDRTAYRYITIDDSDTTWQEVVLDADVTNSSFWSYNLHPPDPTKMKFLVFVIESYFNNPAGTFYIDNIHLIDADDSLFDLDQHTDGEFLESVSEKTFLYFLDWYDPNTGLFQDRSTFPDLMSTAATGFGLTALTIGESRGWISQTLAVEMVTRTLQTLCEGQAVTNTVTDTITGTNGYKGFFYHFLDNNGLRKTEIVTSTNTITGSELSPVDTAILIAGVLTAKEHFSNGDIDDLADELYGRVEWDWILDPGNNWFYLAWKPECGPDYETEDSGGGCFSNYYWNYYTDEVILINLLAIDSPTYPVSPEVFYAWTREWGTYRDHTLIKSWTGSFFTYVFAHLWVDFSILRTDNHPTPTLQVDWWDNSVKAAWANWEFVADHQDDTACDGDDDYTTYGESSWGLTAAEGPDGYYHAYGAPPAAITPTIYDGTIAPYGAGMATMFLPATSTLTLKHYFADTDLWRYRFGFGDAYNLDPPNCNGPWYNYATFGIDQGPMLIAIENYRSGLVWDTMKRNDHIRRALQLIWLRVSISGPTTGTVNAAQTFTATVAPALATTPITYVWQASGQSLVTHTRGLSDTASFIWAQPGTQVITVTVTNVVSTVVATHVITIYAPPTDVMVTGSTTGVIDSSYVFTATVSPATTTLPIDYVWQATDNSLEIHTDGGLSDTVVLDWYTRGMKAITVTATNIVSTVVATHATTIFTPPQAAFRASPISGFAPLTVVFTNTSTGDYIASLWDFGDEVTSTLESPTHTYTAVGVYTVTLMISGLGASDTEMKVEYIAVQEEYGIYLPLVAATSDDRAQAGSSATKPLRLGQRCALPSLPTALRRRRPTIEDPEHFQRSTTNTTSSGTYSGGSSIPGRP